MNWSFLVLLVFVYVIDCEGRGKRQLFREDIPHYRPLDGSYNQRPQGEGSQPGVEGTIPGDPNNPVRFDAQDAIMGSQIPPPRGGADEQQFNPYQHHQPIIYNSVTSDHSSGAPNSYPSGYPQQQQQQQYSAESHEVYPLKSHGIYPVKGHGIYPVKGHGIYPVKGHEIYPINPPPPPPPTGPYRLPPPHYPIHPPSGPSAPFETRLKALWNLNYDNGRKNNGAVSNNMVVSLDNRPKKKVNKRNKRRRKKMRTQAEEHLRSLVRLNGPSFGSSAATTNGQSIGGPANNHGYNYRESLNGATILLNGREYVMNLNGFKNGQQQSNNNLSNPVPVKSVATAASILTSSNGDLQQFQVAANQ